MGIAQHQHTAPTLLQPYTPTFQPSHSPTSLPHNATRFNATSFLHQRSYTIMMLSYLMTKLVNSRGNTERILGNGSRLPTLAVLLSLCLVSAYATCEFIHCGRLAAIRKGAEKDDNMGVCCTECDKTNSGNKDDEQHTRKCNTRWIQHIADDPKLARPLQTLIEGPDSEPKAKYQIPKVKEWLRAAATMVRIMSSDAVSIIVATTSWNEMELDLDESAWREYKDVYFTARKQKVTFEAAKSIYLTKKGAKPHDVKKIIDTARKLKFPLAEAWKWLNTSGENDSEHDINYFAPKLGYCMNGAHKNRDLCDEARCRWQGLTYKEAVKCLAHAKKHGVTPREAKKHLKINVSS